MSIILSIYLFVYLFAHITSPFYICTSMSRFLFVSLSYVCPLIYLCQYIFLYNLVCLSMCQSVYPLYFLISVHLSMCQASNDFSVSPSIYLSVYLYIYLFARLFTCQPICVFHINFFIHNNFHIAQSMWVSVCLSTVRSVCPSIHLSLCLFISPSFQSLCVYAHLSVYCAYSSYHETY